MPEAFRRRTADAVRIMPAEGTPSFAARPARVPSSPLDVRGGRVSSFEMSRSTSTRSASSPKYLASSSNARRRSDSRTLVTVPDGRRPTPRLCTSNEAMAAAVDSSRPDSGRSLPSAPNSRLMSQNATLARPCHVDVDFDSLLQQPEVLGQQYRPASSLQRRLTAAIAPPRCGLMEHPGRDRRLQRYMGHTCRLSRPRMPAVGLP
jgi:hypothetical protein